MAGEYQVTFAFDETAALAPNYQRRDPKLSGAAEAVIVVEDSPGHIVLQHLLLAGDDGVIGHWTATLLPREAGPMNRTTARYCE